MPVSMKELGIDRLSVEERLELVDEILESVDDEPREFDMPDWHRELLRERLAAHELNPTAGLTWEEMKQRILADEDRP